MGVIKDLMCNTKPMTDKDYAISKIALIVSGAAACCCASFTSNSYFSALLKFVGASEILSNYILSVATLAGIFVLIVPYLTTNLKYKKPYVVLCSLFEYLSLSLAFLLPVMTSNKIVIVSAATLLFLMHNVAVNFKLPAHQEWMVNCASGRGGKSTFFGIKDGIANGVLIVTYLVLGVMTKYFVGEKEGMGYTVIGIIGIATWLISMIFTIVTKEPYIPPKEQVKVNILKMFKDLLSHKPYMTFFIYQILYIFGLYSINSIIPIMCVQRFEMKLEIISYYTAMDLILRTFLCVFFGKLADKIGTKIPLAIAMIGYVGNSFFHFMMTPDNMYLFKGIASVFLSLANGALCAPAFVFMFECMPKENTSSFIACHNVIILLLATVVSFVSAFAVNLMAGFSITVFGHTFNEMNIIFLFSTIVFVFVSIYLVVKNKHKENS